MPIIFKNRNCLIKTGNSINRNDLEFNTLESMIENSIVFDNVDFLEKLSNSNFYFPDPIIVQTYQGWFDNISILINGQFELTALDIGAKSIYRIKFKIRLNDTFVEINKIHNFIAQKPNPSSAWNLSRI